MKDMKTLCDQVRQVACLKSSRLEDGFLINFGSYKFEIRKFAWSENVQRNTAVGLSALLSVFFAFLAVK